MSQTRTTVTLDDDLVRRAKSITKTDSLSALVTVALEQMVRADARRRLASLMGTDTEPTEAPPRRPPPEFTNSPVTGKAAK